LPGDATSASAPVLLIFAGIAQFIAGLTLMAARMPCPAPPSALALALLFQASALLHLAPGSNLLAGFFFESFGFIAFPLGLAALRTNMALFAVFGTLCVGYVLSGIPYLTEGAAPGVVGLIGACFLLASAFFTYDAGAALIVNSIWKHTLLPLGGEP
jgi:succinate-acetate transporter protein